MYFPSSYFRMKMAFTFTPFTKATLRPLGPNSPNLQVVGNSSKRILSLISDEPKSVGPADAALCEILRNV